MLIQQEFKHDEWKMLVGCIMLNQTHNRQVRRVINKFFDTYPSPECINENEIVNMVNILKPLGFYNRRAKTILKFSIQYLKGEHKKVSDLYGIGKYASDSYEIFINNNLDVNPTDKILRAYLRGEFIDQ